MHGGGDAWWGRERGQGERVDKKGKISLIVRL